ncbi:MAG: dTDP-4-dehydrorhamnose 3,5-epimerase [Salibacteraceae bacterium]
MKFHSTALEGVFAVDLFHASDDRGTFVKTFHRDTFTQRGLQGRFDESYYSTNHAGVIRGMHFQLPPHEHEKIVYCTSGKLHDVLLDIRKDSPTYGQTTTVELSGDNYRAVYIPQGIAHGFVVLEDNTCMVYLTATMYHPDSDTGIRWDSFDYDWPAENPIVSARDQSFLGLSEFKSPF